MRVRCCLVAAEERMVLALTGVKQGRRIRGVNLFVVWAKVGLGLVGLSWDWIWFLVELNLGSG